ncbi:putative high osmolarity signaling protein Sho1 [Kalaharituber pfeilii]|nr:putative high osmolarity signaling protein Sho1 [Kalaharituber pfeilii]
MPFYASIPSPSLRKMNGQDPSQRGGRFDFGNIAGDPFALATISVSVLAWLIATVGSAIAEIQGKVNGFIWWTIAYQFCCVAGVTLVVGYGSHQRYSLAVVGYLAAGLVNTSLAADHLVASSQPAREAAAAGFILFAMVEIIWIGYFGQNTSTNNYGDMYAMAKDQKHGERYGPYGSNRPETSTSSHNTPQMYTSAQLGGNFETSITRPGENSKYLSGTTPPASTPTPGVSAAAGADQEIAQPTEYPYRAQAMYSYEANPEDANEISFQKHEILDVWDVSGRWWQARKANGETGIAPSNYLVLLS